VNVLVDMNLSPAWASFLARNGHPATHWSAVGSPHAKDRTLLEWARQRDHVVFTHDLDFGAILAATGADAPSVVQVRSADPTPTHCGRMVLDAPSWHADALRSGAMVSVDEVRARLRILPLRRDRL